ncbi:TPA: hypothetical protein ACH3X1_013507 [Trebouxia sp. C0004]
MEGIAKLKQQEKEKGRSDAAQGIVIVQFEKKQHKITVFKARGKLAGTTIGLDDDLTILQQRRKNAAWPAFKDFRSRGVKTQWRAEKLFVKEGAEHKVKQACFLRHFNKIRPTPTTPYEGMQNDVLEYQGKGAQILTCGDFNARTAEEPDFLRMAELHSFLPTVLNEDELPGYVRQRRNKDLLVPGSPTWGPELLPTG